MHAPVCPVRCSYSRLCSPELITVLWSSFGQLAPCFHREGEGPDPIKHDSNTAYTAFLCAEGCMQHFAAPVFPNVGQCCQGEETPKCRGAILLTTENCAVSRPQGPLYQGITDLWLHYYGIPPRADPNPLYLHANQLLDPCNIFSSILRQILPSPHLHPGVQKSQANPKSLLSQCYHARNRRLTCQ